VWENLKDNVATVVIKTVSNDSKNRAPGKTRRGVAPTLRALEGRDDGEFGKTDWGRRFIAKGGPEKMEGKSRFGMGGKRKDVSASSEKEEETRSFCHRKEGTSVSRKTLLGVCSEYRKTKGGSGCSGPPAEGSGGETTAGF